MTAPTPKVFGIFGIIADHKPNGIVAGFSVLLPYFILSFTLNTLISLLIIIRILFQRRLVKNTIGVDHSKPYISVVAMITESALLYAIVYLMFIIPYVLNNPADNFLNLMGEVQVRNALLAHLL